MSIIDKVTYKKLQGIDITDTASDDQLQLVLDAVTDGLDSYLDRTLEASDRKTWLDGSGRGIMLLPEYPVNNIYYACIGDEYVGEIEYSGSQDFASVQFDGSTFTLISFNSSGTQSTNTVAISSNATIADVQTAINAVTDWSMSIDRSDRSTDSSAFIRPITSAYANSSSAFEVRLPINGLTVELADRSDRGVLISPANTITGSFSSGAWPAGYRNVFFWYNAGYTFPTDADPSLSTVPKDLQLAAAQIVQDVIDLADISTVVTDFKLADYSQKLNAVTVANAVRGHGASIDRYRRVPI